jgi:hypothetical protein
MIIVTGGAGFIGSNIVKGLNDRGREDVLVVDDLKDGTKFLNLVDCEILDYLDKDDFIGKIRNGTDFGESVDAIFHEGACSATTEWDGLYMMLFGHHRVGWPVHDEQQLRVLKVVAALLPGTQRGLPVCLLGIRLWWWQCLQ